MRSTIFTRPRVLAGAVALVVVLATATGAILRAAGQLPAPPPSPGRAVGSQQPRPSVSVPGQAPDPYFVAAPSTLAGKVLHWTMAGVRSTPSSPDPANGKPTNSEVWAQMGPDNAPTRLRARTTLADGTLLQERVASGGKESLYLGAGYNNPAAKPPPVPPACPQPRSSSAQALASTLPLFANQAMLPGLGFQTTAGTTQLPTTPPLTGVKPSASYPANSAIPIWAHSTAANGTTHLDEVQIDSSGRVQMVHSRSVTASGDVTETKMSYGNLDVYEPSAVPPTVFDPSPEAKAVCHA
jgi:hypothetical protein